jgi:hypothetical protein
MASFAEFIAESFYSTVNLTWSPSGPKRSTASFSVDSIAVEVAFEQQESGAAWNISFDVQRGEPGHAVHASFQMFNGVFQAVREFLEVRSPELLVFTTKRDSLAGIYETYLRREQPEIERLGYRLEGPQRVAPYQQFTLRRIRPSTWIDR